MDNQKIKPYLLIEKLLEERRALTLASLCGSKLDLTKAREIATQLNAYDPETYPFDISGSDVELWLSVKDFFNQ